MAPPRRVEERTEHAGGVEAIRAIPVDRPVRADQRHAVHVTDDSMFGDRQERRRVRSALCVADATSGDYGAEGLRRCGILSGGPVATGGCPFPLGGHGICTRATAGAASRAAARVVSSAPSSVSSM